MDRDEEYEVLLKIRQHCLRQPEFITRVVNAAFGGLVDQNEVYRSHASEMENVAMMALNGRLFKGNEHTIADKLDKWKDFNGLNWDKQVAKLRKKK